MAAPAAGALYTAPPIPADFAVYPPAAAVQAPILSSCYAVTTVICIGYTMAWVPRLLLSQHRLLRHVVSKHRNPWQYHRTRHIYVNVAVFVINLLLVT